MTISAGPWSGWWSATIQRLFAILQLSYSQTSSGRGWHSIQDFNKCVLHDLMFRLLHQNCSPSTSSGNHERIISLRLLASADRGKVWLLAGQMLLPVLPVRPWFAWTDLPNRPNQQRFVRSPNSLEWTRTVRVDHTHTQIYIYIHCIYIYTLYIYTLWYVQTAGVVCRKRSSAQGTCVTRLVPWGLHRRTGNLGWCWAKHGWACCHIRVPDIHLPREYVPHSVLRLAWAWTCQKEGMRKVMESYKSLWIIKASCWTQIISQKEKREAVSDSFWPPLYADGCSWGQIKLLYDDIKNGAIVRTYKVPLPQCLVINTLNMLISYTRASDNEDFGLWNCVESISPRG